MHFEEIYKVYWNRIFRVCMGYVNDKDWAKDITQETFIVVWQQLPHFRNEAAISTWIFRIASNQCLKQIEKQNRLTKGDMPIEIEEKPETNNEEQIQLLYRYISELNEIDRLIISLELEDVKQADIAEILGISDTHVRVKIHRIKEKLTQKFKHDDHG